MHGLYTTIQNRHRNPGRYFEILVYPGSSWYIGVYRCLSYPKIGLVGVCRYLS